MAKTWRDLKDRVLTAAPDSPEAAIRRIEIAANEAFPDDMGKRFAYRNELRAAAGLPPEERVRGGLGAAVDKGFLLPAAAMLLGPMALGALGSGGAAAGTAGSAAGGAVPAAAGTAAGAAGGAVAPVAAGSLMSKGVDWLKKNGLNAATQIAGVVQQQKGTQMAVDAAKRDERRWAEGKPLRDAGRAAMLAPVAADTSSLRPLAHQGNPFAPVPASRLR